MRLPKIKLVHNPIRLSENRIRVGTIQYGVSSEIMDDEAGTIWHLMQLMDGTRTTDAIVNDMQGIFPELDADSLRDAISDLIEAGFVDDMGADPPLAFTPDELERYSRSTEYFSWVDATPRSNKYEIQSKLKTARVTLLGLGGSGSAVAMSLVAAGIGSLHVVDFDKIEVSNLNRQLLYVENDIGLPKVEQSMRRLRQMNSHVQITGQELKVQSVDELVPLMESCDLLILCADKPRELILRWTNEAAHITRTPWMMCLYAGPMLVVGIFDPFHTPCYECMNHDENNRNLIRDGRDSEYLYDIFDVNAVIAPTASLTGHLGALEAIYFLTDLQPQTLGRIFHQNLMIYDHLYYIEPPFWVDCPVCGKNPS
ncbi:MAG: ThiF family adenylyltransferase [Anaerolineales bacterium]|nr:ThiF family adenylyltransferase [Anaerolineales bacterium]MCB8951238.1 ThiF family adenylyltransferase [Ardenticatenales bacterium]